MALVVLCVGASTSAWAADPFNATYARDRDAIFWIVQISDAHIGASAIEGPDAPEHLTWAVGEAVDVIGPAFVVNTGDLVDGSLSGIPASGQDQQEWDDYVAIVDGAGMAPDYYRDLAGNHDGYGDIGLGYYLANSVNGPHTGLPYWEVWLNFPFGDYLLYGVNTAGEGSNPFIEKPAYTDVQLAALTAALDDSATAELVLLFGHHRITAPDNSAAVVTLAADHGAFWFHGHEHEYGSYLEEAVVSAQVDSLGKKSTDNLAVIAVDHDAVSYAATGFDDPWPLVVITAPANSRLDSGDVNTYAYEVCNTDPANPVRALVFDVAPVTEVSFSAGSDAPVAMTQDADDARLWYGEWDTSGLPEGETTLTVTAEGTSLHTATITVQLADVECPPALDDEPDGGPVDGGTGDDAGAGIGPDASPGGGGGNAGDDGGGGCGCRTSSGADAGLAPILAVGWLLVCVRRRRRARGWADLTCSGVAGARQIEAGQPRRALEDDGRLVLCSGRGRIRDAADRR